jgi:hypothetical protein
MVPRDLVKRSADEQTNRTIGQKNEIRTSSGIAVSSGIPVLLPHPVLLVLDAIE